MADCFLLRSTCLDRLSAFRDDTAHIKIITGVRRSGKTVLISQYTDLLKAQGISEDRIFRFDFDGFEMTDADGLLKTVREQVPANVRTYVFFDEVQNIKKWEKAIADMMDSTDADVYVTGSNSNILSSECTAYLAGRYVRIDVFPLSFPEWKELHRPDADDMTAFREYMKYGGFPRVDPDDGMESARTVLSDIIGSVFAWDICGPGRACDIGALNRMTAYLLDRAGDPVSLSRMTEELGCSRTLIDKYMGLLTGSFLFQEIDAIDMRKDGRPRHRYYPADHSMIGYAAGTCSGCEEKVMKSIICLELRRRRYCIQIGRYGDDEVDFVATGTPNGKDYYQVCMSLNNRYTEKIHALEKINDSFPKTVITLDPVVSHFTEKGVKVICITKWLKESTI